HSTIKAVLAEYNWSYTESRPTLLDLASKSWRFSLTNFVFRRKTLSPEEHPLIYWSSSANRTRPPKPKLRHTPNAQLNKELWNTVIMPLREKRKAELEASDRRVAEQINEAQAEEASELYDCECCFTAQTMEQMSSCDDKCHFICYRCIRHAISEALYGQGWARNIDVQRATVRCLAPNLEGEECSGCIEPYFTRTALLQEKDGEQTFRKLEERAATEALIKSQLPLIRCPLCPYAEVDDLRLHFHPRVTLKSTPLIGFLSLLFLQISYFFPIQLAVQLLALFSFLFASVNYLRPMPANLFAPFTASFLRIARQRRGLRFTCASPYCSQSSCLNCKRPWPANSIHSCYDSEKMALRTAVEAAMAEAVKRTCPQCNTSFVKSAGCNKLTCVCGYNMCYVCRQKIGDEGYAHFCQHFRVKPGAVCTECDKCDLYRTEDEDAVIRRAKERAEKQWREKEGEIGEGFDWEVKAGPGCAWSTRLRERSFWEGALDKVVVAFVA
ncbi:hypothetical protein LTS18_011036, partial [Coniosporium uncinatum]